MTGTALGQAVLAAVLVITALVLQLTVLAPLPLPLGGTPDLLVLVVVSFGLLHGPVFGMAVGFGAGLLLGLVPPSDSAVGLWALVLCVVGHLAGLASAEADRSALAPLAIVLGLTVIAVVGFAGLSVLLGSPRVTWSGLAQVTLSTAAYTVVLAPFVVPLITRLSLRLDPEGIRR